ncbi:hypothetical protein AVEN_84932-1 [Araneus ventricosus]|uniref:Uncharacterized protein n=1 Tax=Araneus ventricosus TaxID=182803 RepID=A0A4Y2C0V0_ARAVE|nr:hypothetical protein AVEN_84932-1 [Araneus ventricosus]
MKNLPSSYYHSQENRPDVLGTPDPELVNQGHAMPKHSRARSHHSLYITDPHWATPTRPLWANVKGTSTCTGCHISNTKLRTLEKTSPSPESRARKRASTIPSNTIKSYIHSPDQNHRVLRI